MADSDKDADKLEDNEDVSSQDSETEAEGSDSLDSSPDGKALSDDDEDDR